MKITKTDTNLIFEFPLKLPRFNPYDEDGDYGNYPNFTGLIITHDNENGRFTEMGFAHTIDMFYKDKEDQVGNFAIMWDGDKKSFEEECRRLEIHIYYIND